MVLKAIDYVFDVKGIDVGLCFGCVLILKAVEI